MTTIEDLLALYHSINDTSTTKEKRKHFNEFLLTFHSQTYAEEDLNAFVNSLKPKTPLEETFRIDVILRLERKDIILQELKKCNYILVKKLLRNWKLFGKIFANITANEAINDIFPHLSYSLKLKILKGISKNVRNEVLLDEYFNALEEKYGLKIATCILPGCSIHLIRSIIAKYHLKLRNSYLKRIFKKDKQFVPFYFEVVKKKYENINFSRDYEYTLKYVAKIDPIIYWQICEQFDLTLKFGKYMTPIMIKSHKSIIEKADTALDTFHLVHMYKILKRQGNLNKFLLNLCPETHYNFSKTCLEGSLFDFTKRVSPATQYNLISAIFTEKYGKNLLDYSSYYTKALLEITPIKEREEILKLKVDKEEDLSYLFSTAVSVPKYKEQLIHTSNGKTRCEIASRLYDTCAVNKDEDALLDVMKYIFNRYKNDTNFLTAFYERVIHWPNVIDLSEEHWECLANIFKILQHSRIRNRTVVYFNSEYITHLLKNNKSCHEIVNDIVKDTAEGRARELYYSIDGQYLQVFCDEMVKCMDEYKNSDKYRTLCIRFLSYIIHRADLKKGSYISNYRHMFNELEDADDWESTYIVTKCVPLDDPIIHDLFWKMEGSSSNQSNKNLLWYAKHRPEILKENADKIFSRMEPIKPKVFLRKFYKLLDTDLIQKIKTCTLQHVQEEEYEEAKISIGAISILAPETFLEIIPAFLPPSDGKVDLEQSKDKRKCQQVIARSLANIKDPLKSFPIILQFCSGDYLKFGLHSLYSPVYNSSEMQSKIFLSKFPNRSISVRKHVLNLARHVLISNDFYELINEWSTTEKNLSIRNIIVKKIIGYLIENPSEQFWNMLKNNLKLIDVKDREFHDFLMKFQKLPSNYQPDYIKTLYELLSGNPDIEIRKKRFKLIDEIPPGIMDALNTTFVKEVIRQTACTETVTKFHWKCVFFARKEKQLELFEENIKALKKVIDENYVDLVQNFQTRSKITNFLLAFYTLAVEIKQGGNLVQKFISLWPSLFNPENFNKNLILIHFTNSYFISKFDAYDTGMKISSLLYDYINKYNNCIIHLFCLQLRIFLNTACITGNDLYNFVNGMFHHKKDENTYIAVMYLLPGIIPTHNNAYENYIPILNVIANCDAPLVKYYFNSYLTNDSNEQKSYSDSECD